MSMKSYKENLSMLGLTTFRIKIGSFQDILWTGTFETMPVFQNQVGPVGDMNMNCEKLI